MEGGIVLAAVGMFLWRAPATPKAVQDRLSHKGEILLGQGRVRQAITSTILLTLLGITVFQAGLAKAQQEGIRLHPRLLLYRFPQARGLPGPVSVFLEQISARTRALPSPIMAPRLVRPAPAAAPGVRALPYQLRLPALTLSKPAGPRPPLPSCRKLRCPPPAAQ